MCARRGCIECVCTPGMKRRERAGQDSYSDGGMQRKCESHPPTPFKPASSSVSLTSPGQLLLVLRGWRSGARADVVSCSPR